MTASPERKMVDRIEFIDPGCDLPSLQALRDHIEALIARVPADYQASAVIEAGHEDRGGSYITWQAPETDALSDKGAPTTE